MNVHRSDAAQNDVSNEGAVGTINSSSQRTPSNAAGSLNVSANTEHRRSTPPPLMGFAHSNSSEKSHHSEPRRDSASVEGNGATLRPAIAEVAVQATVATPAGTQTIHIGSPHITSPLGNPFNPLSPGTNPLAVSPAAPNKTGRMAKSHAIQLLELRSQQYANSRIDAANQKFFSSIDEVFKAFDDDGSETIDAEELKGVLQHLGYDLSAEQINELLYEIGKDPSRSESLNKVEFRTLIQLWMTSAQFKVFKGKDLSASQSREERDDSRSNDVTVVGQLRKKKASSRSHAALQKVIPNDVVWRWPWLVLLVAVVGYFWTSTFALYMWKYDYDGELNRFHHYFIIPDVFCTLVLFVEVLMRFQIATSDAGVRDSVEEITQRYLQSWFPFDVFVCIPWDLFFVSSHSLASFALRHIRLLLALRISSWLDSSKRMTMTTAYITFHMTLLPMITWGIGFFCVVFSVAMGHYFLLNDWYFGHEFLGLVDHLTFQQEGPGARSTFTSSFYWAMYVMSGVGFGTVPVQGDGMRWYACFACCGSMVANGVVIGGIVSTLQQSNIISKKQSALVEFNAILDFFSVPSTLTSELLQFQDHLLQHTLEIAHRDLVDLLPSELCFNMVVYSRLPLVSALELFHEAHESFLVRICHSFETLVCAPEQYLAVCGEENEDYFIVNFGFIDVQSSSGEYLTTIKRGDGFGDVGLLLPGCLFTLSYKALTYADMFVLSQTEADAILSDHPRLRAKLELEMTIKKQSNERLDADPAEVSAGRSPRQSSDIKLSAGGSPITQGRDGFRPFLVDAFGSPVRTGVNGEFPQANNAAQAIPKPELLVEEPSEAVLKEQRTNSKNFEFDAYNVQSFVGQSFDNNAAVAPKSSLLRVDVTTPDNVTNNVVPQHPIPALSLADEKPADAAGTPLPHKRIVNFQDGGDDAQTSEQQQQQQQPVGGGSSSKRRVLGSLVSGSVNSARRKSRAQSVTINGLEGMFVEDIETLPPKNMFYRGPSMNRILRTVRHDSEDPMRHSMSSSHDGKGKRNSHVRASDGGGMQSSLRESTNNTPTNFGKSPTNQVTIGNSFSTTSAAQPTGAKQRKSLVFFDNRRPSELLSKVMNHHRIQRVQSLMYEGSDDSDSEGSLLSSSGGGSGLLKTSLFTTDTDEESLWRIVIDEMDQLRVLCQQIAPSSNGGLPASHKAQHRSSHATSNSITSLGSAPITKAVAAGQRWKPVQPSTLTGHREGNDLSIVSHAEHLLLSSQTSEGFV